MTGEPQNFKAVKLPLLDFVVFSEGESQSQHTSVALNEFGRPRIQNQEKLISKWLCVGDLAGGASAASQGEELPGLAKGALALAVTDQRLLMSFTDAYTVWGDVIDPHRNKEADEHAVLAASWPFDQLDLVFMGIKQRRFKGTQVGSCGFNCSEPGAQLTITQAQPADGEWLGRAGEPHDPDGQYLDRIAQEVAQAAIEFRISNQIGDARRLNELSDAPWAVGDRFAYAELPSA